MDFIAAKTSFYINDSDTKKQKNFLPSCLKKYACDIIRFSIDNPITIMEIIAIAITEKNDYKNNGQKSQSLS